MANQQEDGLAEAKGILTTTGGAKVG